MYLPLSVLLSGKVNIMEFNSNYDFFFENHGKCPECGAYLVPHDGCPNLNCELNSQIEDVKEFLRKKKYGEKMKKHREGFDAYFKYWTDRKFEGLRAYWAKRNVDNADKKSHNEKSYSKNI